MRIANLVPAGYSDGFSPSPSVVALGVTVATVEMDLPAFPDDPIGLLLTDLAAVEAAVRAEAEGFDAFFVNSVADYGLRAIRSAVRVPTVGAGQASMLLACQLGRKFSIVSILSPSLRDCHEAQLRDYGLTGHCASMRFVTSNDEMARVAEEDSFYFRMRARKADMIERIAAEARAAISEDNATAIVLGCTCMAPVANDIASLVDVPVINPLDAAFLHAQMLVRLGLTHSVRAHPPARFAQGALLAAVTRGAQGAMQSSEQGCVPCAIAGSGEACDLTAGAVGPEARTGH